MTRAATPQLAAFFASARTTLAFDLWTIVLLNGQTLQWTNADKTIAALDGRVFSSGRGVPIIERSQVTWQRGVQTDTLDVTLAGDATTLVGGVAMVHFAVADGFSGAAVKLERVFFDEQLVQQGSLIWFVGVVADVEPDRYVVTLHVKDDVSKLDIMMPRNLYQPGCSNTLFDTLCSVNPALYAVNLSVSATSATNPRGFARAAFAGRPNGYFALGRFRFNSGQNVGISRTVQSMATDGTITDFVFGRPFPFPIAVNDVFTVWPGCDKQEATCGGKFRNNGFTNGRFKGTPFIPDATTVT